MEGLMQGAIAAATQVLAEKPLSWDNRGQQEAARLLNNPWVIENIQEGYSYQEHKPEFPILPKYLIHLKRELRSPDGSIRILHKLTKAQRVLLGE